MTARNILFGINGRQAVVSFLAAVFVMAATAAGLQAADGDVTVDLGNDDGTSAFSVVDASSNERLQLTDDGTYIVRGEFSSGADLTESGAGARLVWYPKKAAFRVGQVDGDQWDNANIGNNSIAMGINTTASGILSTAVGPDATASGNNSMALGRGVTASGDGSTAVGRESTSSANYSMAFGYQATASKGGATAFGWQTTASGKFATAMGYNTEASGYYSTATGRSSKTIGHHSVSMGYGTTAQHFCSTVLGKYNQLDAVDHIDSTSFAGTDYLFVVGNGTDDSNRSNALSVFGNGDAELAGDLTANGTTYTSDIRYKTDIETITDALSIVSGLRGVRYDWNREAFPEKRFSDSRQIGFIAQELETELPELVKTDGDGYKSVDYAKTTAVLVEAVKELDERNQDLEDQVQALAARLSKLEALITGN